MAVMVVWMLMGVRFRGLNEMPWVGWYAHTHEALLDIKNSGNFVVLLSDREMRCFIVLYLSMC